MPDPTKDSLLPEESDDSGAWRPAWEDTEGNAAEVAVPPWSTPSQSRSPQRDPGRAALLGRLAAAEDALSRLDAGAEAASDAVREGLVARLAFAEAAGWLATAADHAWVHPRDLALAEAGLLGSFTAAALGGRPARALPATAAAVGRDGRASAEVALAAEVDRLPDGAALAGGFALARALRRLAGTGWDPLASPEAAAAALAPLGAAAAEQGSVTPLLRLEPARFVVWRQSALAAPPPRHPDREPSLLAAAAAAAAWMGAGALEDSWPTPSQALLLAAAVARRRGRVQAVFLPFWGLGPLERPTVLPLEDLVAWPGVFLGQVAAAARRGLAELARLRDAEAAAAFLARTGGGRRRSLLPAAADTALRMPALTAAGLAKRLGVTPQGALLLLQRLEAAGVVQEATGRRSYRAWVA